MEDSYLTIERESECEIKIKASRFLGETRLVTSGEQALDRLEEIRRREYQANHHCFALITGLGAEQQFKYSDDGEPNGTAGRPIYDVIAGRQLTNLLVVVTRYFGGTKLGTGGLVRAYSDTAREAIEQSGIRTNYQTDHYRLRFDFSFYDRIQRELHALEAEITESSFSDTVTLEVRVRQSRSDKLKSWFVELTSGKGELDEL